MRVPRVGVVIKEPLGREGIGVGNDLRDSHVYSPSGDGRCRGRGYGRRVADLCRRKLPVTLGTWELGVWR